MRAEAAVLYEVRKPLVVDDVEVLEPGPGEVRVRWAANGVCHSDLHVVTGRMVSHFPRVRPEGPEQQRDAGQQG